MATNTANTKETDLDEAKALGVKESKVKMSSFKDKDSVKIERETKKHEKLCALRIENRIAKAKVLAKMKPIDKRRALLVGRFKAVRAKARTYTYSDKVIEAWTEEFKVINNDPKMWITATANGTTQFVPGNRKKKTPKERLDAMDLD